MLTIKRLCVLISLSLLAPLLSAQEVYWTPSSGTVQEGKSNTLQLNFEGCEPEGTVEPPQSSSVELRQIGQSTSTQIFNGRVIRKLVLSYQAIPTGSDEAVIPSFTVETDEGPITVEEQRYPIVEATVGRTGAKIDEVFYSQLENDDDTIYEGEIFDMRYIIGIKQGYNINDISEPVWSPLGLITKGLDEFNQGQFTVDGKPHRGLIYRFKAMANRSGPVRLPSVSQTVSMVVGRRPGFIFDDPVVENYSIESNDLTLDVQPLPPGAPASFTGAVGAFEIESNIAPNEVQIGEPITWTLSVKGEGNWPQGFGIAPRSVYASFRAIQPDVKKEISEDSPFEGSLTEDIVLIPTQAGDFTLGPVEFTYFDPQEERYVTVSVPEKTVTVDELTPQAPVPTPQGSGDSTGPTDGVSPDSKIDRPIEVDPIGFNQLAKPIELPRDPIARGNTVGRAPSGPIGLWPLVWPVSASLALWLVIAIVRSALKEPNRPRKLALKRLRQIAGRELPADSVAARETLRDWRDQVRIYWNVNTREPSASELRDAIGASASEEAANQWASLWNRSDVALYGPQESIDERWLADFRDALQSAKRPRSSHVSLLFSRKAWFAAAGAIALLAVLPQKGVGAETDEGLTAYREGDFETATTIWANEAAAQPLDWALRHNLGLAAAQQEQWGSAIAHFSAALLLNPDSESARWNLRIALNKSPSYHPSLIDLVERRGAFRFAGLLSPAQWERVATTAILLTTIFALAWTARMSLSRHPRFQWLVGTGALVGAIAYLAAQWSIDVYGDLARPETLVASSSGELLSVPTDLDVPQLTTQLDEGSLAQPVKDFLGWLKVQLPNGEEGWARKDAFTPLYQSPK